MPRKWTPDEIELVRANVGKLTHAQIAEQLGRPASAVKAYCSAHRHASRTLWTADQDKRLREIYGTMDAREIAVLIGRHVSSVRNRCHALRLGQAAGRTRIYHGPEFEAFIREKHAHGWSATEVAAAYSPMIGRKVDRHTVISWWNRMGLQPPLHSEHQRAKVRAKTAEQLKAAGIPTLAQLRLKKWAEHARRLGWPDDLRPRAIQILNALYAIGPMSRQEIAAAIGMPWKGSRKSLVSNDPEGSYLANLMNRGLVVCLGRIRRVVGKGRGHSTCVYSLPLHVQPNPQTNTEDAHVA